MQQYNPMINRLDIPKRLLKLPVDSRGYIVPKFVEWIDGKPDFRVVSSEHFMRCIRHKLCWICGERLGRNIVFTIGPMCAINRISSEPPSHLDCARFSAKACPFLVQPKRIRDDRDLPEAAKQPGGIMIDRNPGVTLLWITDRYRTFEARGGQGDGIGRGVLFNIGEPTRLEWYARGRTATREEILDSINSGLPILREVAERNGEIAEFDKEVARGMALVPTA